MKNLENKKGARQKMAKNKKMTGRRRKGGGKSELSFLLIYGMVSPILPDHSNWSEMMNDDIFETFPVMKTPRLVLRDIQPGDIPQFFKIRSDERVMRYMDREPFRSLGEARKMIASITRDYTKKTAVNWAITLRGVDEMIGYIGFWRWMKEHFRAEIAYALLPHYWGKGIMVEAFKEVTRFGFEEMDLHSIEANVNPDNIPSIKLLGKFHFKREAYFKENIFSRGKFCDSAIYSLLEYKGHKKGPGNGKK